MHDSLKEGQLYVTVDMLILTEKVENGYVMRQSRVERKE